MAIDYDKLERLDRERGEIVAAILALKEPVSSEDMDRLAKQWADNRDEYNNTLYPPCPDPATLVTILDIAKAWGAKEDEHGAINGGEFVRLGLPLIGGCQYCHATVGAFNAYPSKSGVLRCKECIGHDGYVTVTEFEMDGNPPPRCSETEDPNA